MKKLLSIGSLFVLVGTLSATTIHVPEEYSTIQGGIDATSNGDTVLVSPGTYLESINYNGKNITVGSLSLTSGNPDYTSQTIIDNNQDGSVVTFENGENSTAVLHGFTIQNGSDNGITCYSNSSPTVQYNVIKNNNTGVYCYYSIPSITNNTIILNETGIVCEYYSSPGIINNIVSHNLIGVQANSLPSPTIEFNLFFSSMIYSSGDGIAEEIGELVTVNDNGDSSDIYFNIYLDPELNNDLNYYQFPDIPELLALPFCADGIDNDEDGLVDDEDDDCGPEGLGEFPPIPVQIPPFCDDGIDNDEDGLTDASDPDCEAGWGYGEFPVPPSPPSPDLIVPPPPPPPDLSPPISTAGTEIVTLIAGLVDATTATTSDELDANSTQVDSIMAASNDLLGAGASPETAATLDAVETAVAIPPDPTPAEVEAAANDFADNIQAEIESGAGITSVDQDAVNAVLDQVAADYILSSLLASYLGGGGLGVNSHFDEQKEFNSIDKRNDYNTKPKTQGMSIQNIAKSNMTSGFGEGSDLVPPANRDLCTAYVDSIYNECASINYEECAEFIENSTDECFTGVEILVSSCYTNGYSLYDECTSLLAPFYDECNSTGQDMFTACMDDNTEAYSSCVDDGSTALSSNLSTAAAEFANIMAQAVEMTASCPDSPLCQYGAILENLALTLFMNQVFVTDLNYQYDNIECTNEYTMNVYNCEVLYTENTQICIDGYNDGANNCVEFGNEIYVTCDYYYTVGAEACIVYYEDGMEICVEAPEINCEEFHAEGMLFCNEFAENYQNYTEDIDLNLTLGSPCIDAGDPDLDSDGTTWETDMDDQDPDGTQMDLGAIYFRLLPEILSIDDVEYDQGGWVFVQFTKCALDTDDPNRIEVYFVQRNDGNIWTTVGSSPALNDSVYQVQVMTLADSTEENDGMTEFRIVAAMDEGTWLSEPAWGYSVDNISPAIPTNLLLAYSGDMVVLTWDQPVDEDFQYFSVYRNGELADYTVEPEFMEIQSGAEYYVTATDANGNESEPSETASGYSVDVANLSGWNLVGLPVYVSDSQQLSVFPESIDMTLFSFDNAYVLESSLTAGTGYWLRFEEAGSTTITGTPINAITLSLNANWNLISGITEAVSVYVIDDPDGIIIENTLFGFTDAYFVTEEILPAEGYWIRTFEAGDITLTSDATARIASQDYSLNANSISINGSELYFGVELSDRERLSYSLPPKPPAGAFDVRFKDGWRAVKDYGEVEVMPISETLTIAYDIMLNAGEHYNWVLTATSGEEYILENAGEITVPSAERFTLELKAVVPAAFTLHQNFPNPFNPITTLSYDLPKDSDVRLAIFDMLGNEVATLVSTSQQAGFKSVQWDATDSMGRPVSAGVYLYQIQAGEFVQTKKMVLLK